MNKWKITHSAYHASQVLALVNAFSTLYENKDYVYSYSVEVTQYYKNSRAMCLLSYTLIH